MSLLCLCVCVCVYMCVKALLFTVQLKHLREGEKCSHACTFATCSSQFSTNGILECGHMVTKQQHMWRFNKMICDTRELKVFTFSCQCVIFSWLEYFILAQPANALIIVQTLSRFSIIQRYPSCPLHMMEILLNRVCMGSPRLCAGAKSPF